MVEDRAEFRVLGPLDVRYRRSSVLPAPQLRGPLSLLVLHHGDVVTDDRLRAHAFGDAGLNAYRTAMSRLRAWLAGLQTSLVYAAGGYRLDIAADDVDAGRFRDLLRASQGDNGIGNLVAALELWRGPVLAGAPDWLTADPVAAALHRERLMATVRLGEVALRAATPEVALPSVATLGDLTPFDEPLHAVRIRLLTAAGRPAAALQHYEVMRTRLRDELGATPSEQLQRAYQETLAVQRGQPPDQAISGSPRWTVARQLRADQADFVGRDADLRALDDLVRPGGIVAISGLGGIGKTTLVVHWANAAADRFVDGQLHIDLRGGGPGEPMPAVEALGHLLRSIGYPPSAIPADEAQAAELYRSLMSGRHALVVLDNAASAAQVRPLLPASATCSVIVTGRRTLTGLVALDGARTHILDVLGPDESVTLVRRIIGVSRVDAEPEAAAQLAALAGHLPLAVRIASASLAVAPHRRIGDLVAALAAGPLQNLAIADDPQASVREVFAHTYRSLDDPLRRLFRLLGIVPGPDAGEAAIAALADAPLDETIASLRQLVEVHLLVERQPGRYAMHDLVRAYAAERLYADEPDEQRAAAGGRFMHWYVNNARSAALAYTPGHPFLYRQERPVAAMASDAVASAWFVSEVDCVAAAIGAAPPLGDQVDVCALADAIRPHLHHSDYSFTSWKALATAAHRAAVAIGDPRAVFSAQLSLSGAYCVTGRYEEGLAYGHAAIATADECGWVEGQWAACGEVGRTLNFLGRHREAVDMCLAAATASRTAGNPALTAQHLISAGIALQYLGRLDEVEATLVGILADLADSCAPRAVRVVRQNLAVVRHMLGRYDAALELVAEVLREIEASGSTDRHLLGCAHDTEAVIRRDRGELHEALDAAEKAVTVMTDLQSMALAETLNTRASILRRLDRNAEAAADHHRALGLAQRHGSAQDEAWSLLGLATSATTDGDRAEAGLHAKQALAIGRDRGLRLVEAEALDILADVARQDGDRILAEEYASASRNLVTESGYAAERQT